MFFRPLKAYELNLHLRAFFSSYILQTFHTPALPLSWGNALTHPSVAQHLSSSTGNLISPTPILQRPISFARKSAGLPASNRNKQEGTQKERGASTALWATLPTDHLSTHSLPSSLRARTFPTGHWLAHKKGPATIPPRRKERLLASPSFLLSSRPAHLLRPASQAARHHGPVVQCRRLGNGGVDDWTLARDGERYVVALLESDLS